LHNPQEDKEQASLLNVEQLEEAGVQAGEQLSRFHDDAMDWEHDGPEYLNVSVY
jgi:hypothetical protein